MRANSRMKAIARKSNNISVLIIVAICIVLGIALMIGRGQLRAKNMEYEAHEAVLESQIANESIRSEELNEYEKYVKSDEFAEKTAREKFGLVGKDEYAIKAEN